MEVKVKSIRPVDQTFFRIQVWVGARKKRKLVSLVVALCDLQKRPIVSILVEGDGKLKYPVPIVSHVSSTLAGTWKEPKKRGTKRGKKT